MRIPVRSLAWRVFLAVLAVSIAGGVVARITKSPEEVCLEKFNVRYVKGRAFPLTAGSTAISEDGKTAEVYLGDGCNIGSCNVRRTIFGWEPPEVVFWTAAYCLIYD